MQVGGQDDSTGSEPSRDGKPPRVAAWSTFGLFAETLFTGVLVAGFGVLVVTFIPAIAAGTSHLRRHLSGGVDSVDTFVADFRVAWRTLWPLAISAPVLAGVLVVNAALVRDGAVPGGRPMMSVMLVLATTLVVVSLRAAAMWRPHLPSGRSFANPHGGTLWIGKRQAVRANWTAMSDAARRSASDPVGTALVVVAVGLCALLAWMLLPLIAVAPGLLAFALVAVEQRYLSRPA
jgi:hypothetical protein